MIKRLITTWATKQVISKSKLYKGVEYTGKRSKSVYLVSMPTKAGLWLAHHGNVAMDNAVMFYLAKKLVNTGDEELEKLIKAKKRTIIPIVEAMIDEDNRVMGDTKSSRLLIDKEI